MDHVQLTAEDRTSIDRAEAALRRGGWASRLTLDGAFETWGALSRELGTGYKDTVEEYSHALTARDWLEAAWPMVSDGVRAAREAELAGLDEAFRESTEDDDGALLGRFFHVTNAPWWWRRRPRLLAGEFAEDVRRTDG
ncbi:MAG TPA: hypothetical protein VFP72_07915 [Kineosporiaceae bacterium]|nr:hypothetical protein [Kineosporiaceae bacterium]